uniref:Phorbol-ester/DAG-type domain-containing protein n=1 Tax=Panagrolaimus sp. JU765 TaxID=591449 RepID=A0AC34QK36_9BILA
MSETDSGFNGGTTDSDNPGSPSIVISNEVDYEFDVFGSDYRTFLHNQIKKVVEAERLKRHLNKNDELNVGIDLCKNLLLEIGNRDERKAAQVMDLMIELKLELVQLKENLTNGLSMEAIVHNNGHELVLQSSTGKNPYCEVCVSTIWRLAQSWRRCSRCGLRTHDRCVADMKLQCAAVIVSSPDFHFNPDICPETSLVDQHYECFECHSPIAFEEGAEHEPRLCDYTGHYYCQKCHWKDELVIPARAIHNWDFVPRPVCRSTKKLLVVAMKKPIINVEKMNPMLVQFVNGMSELCKIRRQILFMKCYFISCRSARKLRILQYLNRYQHFVEESEMYCLDDLIQLATGNLLVEIREIMGVFKKHITEECETCKGHAFICELCSNKEFLFPFTEKTSICRDCCAVFHESCFLRVSRRCPRCSRRESRRLSSLPEKRE